MAPVPQYAWAIDQAGVKLPAAILRGQHYDATSGGIGVGSPRALKVLPQAAPDNTVMILPGGGTAVSTYAGHENQSYQATNFKPQTLEIPPTGSSSGGRTDLIIQRWLDPNEEPHPDYSGDYPIPAEIAKDLWFWRFEHKPGASATTRFDYPHVKLAEIRRPANTTIVTDAHITDLRKLAKANSHPDKYEQMVGERTEVKRTGSWNTLAEVPVDVPEWATHAAIDVGIGGAYMKGVAGRGDFGMTGLGNTSAVGHTPWWEARGDATGFRRIPYIQAGRKLNVRENYRGTTATIYIIARVHTESDSGFIFGADYGARAFVDIIWLQDVE